jgi:predicted small lipoprotein YifL
MTLPPRTRLLLIVLLVLGIQACGQKGPLYLPGDPERREDRLSAVNT